MLDPESNPVNEYVVAVTVSYVQVLNPPPIVLNLTAYATALTVPVKDRSAELNVIFEVVKADGLALQFANVVKVCNDDHAETEEVSYEHTLLNCHS